MRTPVLSLAVLATLLAGTELPVRAEASTTDATPNETSSCGPGDRGQLIRHQLVASYPTAASVRDYFNE